MLSCKVLVMLGTLACAGSGLSSSAAIVCASALAVLGYYGVSVDKGVSTCLSALVPPVQAPASPVPLP